MSSNSDMSVTTDGKELEHRKASGLETRDRRIGLVLVRCPTCTTRLSYGFADESRILIDGQSNRNVITPPTPSHTFPH